MGFVHYFLKSVLCSTACVGFKTFKLVYVNWNTESGMKGTLEANQTGIKQNMASECKKHPPKLLQNLELEDPESKSAGSVNKGNSGNPYQTKTCNTQKQCEAMMNQFVAVIGKTMTAMLAVHTDYRKLLQRLMTLLTISMDGKDITTRQNELISENLNTTRREIADTKAVLIQLETFLLRCENQMRAIAYYAFYAGFPEICSKLLINLNDAKRNLLEARNTSDNFEKNLLEVEARHAGMLSSLKLVHGKVCNCYECIEKQKGQKA